MCFSTSMSLHHEILLPAGSPGHWIHVAYLKYRLIEQHTKPNKYMKILRKQLILKLSSEQIRTEHVKVWLMSNL